MNRETKIAILKSRLEEGTYYIDSDTLAGIFIRRARIHRAKRLIVNAAMIIGALISVYLYCKK